MIWDAGSNRCRDRQICYATGPPLDASKCEEKRRFCGRYCVISTPGGRAAHYVAIEPIFAQEERLWGAEPAFPPARVCPPRQERDQRPSLLGGPRSQCLSRPGIPPPAHTLSYRQPPGTCERECSPGMVGQIPLLPGFTVQPAVSVRDESLLALSQDINTGRCRRGVPLVARGPSLSGPLPFPPSTRMWARGVLLRENLGSKAIRLRS